MASGRSTGQEIGNSFATAITSIGAALGIGRVYNPDEAAINAQMVADQRRLAMIEAETQAEKNKTILTVAGAFLLLLLLVGIGYVAFVKK